MKLHPFVLLFSTIHCHTPHAQQIPFHVYRWGVIVIKLSKSTSKIHVKAHYVIFLGTVAIWNLLTESPLLKETMDGATQTFRECKTFCLNTCIAVRYHDKIGVWKLNLIREMRITELRVVCKGNRRGKRNTVINGKWMLNRLVVMSVKMDPNPSNQ